MLFMYAGKMVFGVNQKMLFCFVYQMVSLVLKFLALNSLIKIIFQDEIIGELQMAQEKLRNYETEIEQLEREVENCNQPVFTEWSNWSVCSCEGSSLNYLLEMYEYSVEKYPG